jgi:hypothetical protein
VKDRTNRPLFLMEAASPEHQRLVQCLVGYMEHEGYTDIRASGLEGYDPPEPIDGYIPDATGVKNGVLGIGEAERCEEVDSDHTRQQIVAFSGRHMTATKQLVPLFLAVPERCCEEVQRWISRTYSGRNISVICCP